MQVYPCGGPGRACRHNESGEVLRARDKGDKTASCMAEETAPGEETTPQTKTNRAEREKDSEGYYHGEYNADLNGAINIGEKIEKAAGEPA